MSDVTKLDNTKTPMELAKEELAKEMADKAVKLIKKKLADLKAAELVVKNIEREIKDLEDRIEQGDID